MSYHLARTNLVPNSWVRRDDNFGMSPDTSNNRVNNNNWKKHELSDEFIAEAANKANRSVGLQNHFENVKVNLTPERVT